MDGVDHILRGEAHLEAELVGDELDGFGVEALVDADEDADGHAGGDDLGDGHVHHGGQLVGGDELGDLEHVLLLHFVHHLLLHLGVDLLSFLAVVLGGFRLAEGREAGEGVADLLLDLVVVDFDRFLLLLLFLLLRLLGLLSGVLLAGGLLLFFDLLLGHFGADLVHILDLFARFLDVFAFLLAAGGGGAVLFKLAEVDFGDHLGAFELLILGLDELGFLLGGGLGFGFD